MTTIREFTFRALALILAVGSVALAVGSVPPAAAQSQVPTDFNRERFARQWGGFRSYGYKRSFGGGWSGRGFHFGGRR